MDSGSRCSGWADLWKRILGALRAVNEKVLVSGFTVLMLGIYSLCRKKGATKDYLAL